MANSNGNDAKRTLCIDIDAIAAYIEGNRRAFFSTKPLFPFVKFLSTLLRGNLPKPLPKGY